MNDRCAYNAGTLAMEGGGEEVTGRQGDGDKRELQYFFLLRIFPLGTLRARALFYSSGLRKK